MGTKLEKMAYSSNSKINELFTKPSIFKSIHFPKS